MLGVLPHRLIKGCSSLKSEADRQHFQNNCHLVMDLETMLGTKFRTDAHFTSYSLQGFDMWPRLNKPILPEIRLEGFDILLNYFTFDWDNKGHGEWDEVALEHFGKLISECKDPIISSWSAIYMSQHGARLIYKISKPMPVDDGEYHLAWMFHHFRENGFDLIDDGCKDWTRYMRCPQVIRDDVDNEKAKTWEQDYYECIHRENTELNINLVGKKNPKTIAHKTYFNREKQEKPEHHVLESQLHTMNPTSNKKIQTEFYKRAKRLLKDSEYLDILFNDAAPGWRQGDRNTQICLMIGKITPPLLKHAYASVVQIFALVVRPLLTLDRDQDWISHGWNALLDIYTREVNKHNIEKEEAAEKISKEIDILDQMIEGMKTWCSDSRLSQDEEQAREFLKSNCLASVRSCFYLMGKEGFYGEFAIQQHQLVSRIRKTHLKDIIPTHKLSYTGETVDVNSTAIQNEFSTPILEVHMRPVGNMGGHIENLNGKKPVLVLSTFCRNENLKPSFNAFVNEWLIHLFGQNYERGCAWLGNALAFEEGLICALSLEGASSAGKKLLSIGLSECLKEPRIATPEDIYGQSSAFLKTPFLVVDESWPTGLGKSSPADKFKSLTGGDGMTVNEKFMPQIRILCPIRLILTANDANILKALTAGKNMGVDNRIAVGERLFHHKVSAKAACYLRTIGGRGFTAKPGQRWIRPDSGSDKSNHVVAKHLLWLWQNRDPVDPSQRFLVMGNCAPGEAGDSLTAIDRLLAESNHSPVVSRAIISMVDSPGSAWQYHIKVNNDLTSLRVTRNGVYKYIKDIMEERLTEPQVYEGMQNLFTSPEPDNIDGVHWYEIDTKLLSMSATERGIAVTKVRQIYVNRIEKGLSR